MYYSRLLIKLVKTFEEELRKSLSQQLTERAMTGLPKSLNRWLHLQLEAIFSYHLQCGCATRKQGTLLYRTGSDLIKALTVALADANAKSQELKALSERVKALETTINETNEDALLKSAAITINEILLQSTRKQIESNADSPEKLSEIDLNHFIASIDPKLWEFITTITRRPRSQEPAVGDTLHSHTLKVRRLYCLCVLMLTTDSRCNTPLHLLLTDMVEMCGGNTELIKTLNRIGAVAAFETLRRLVTKVVAERLQRGIKDKLTTGAFALVRLTTSTRMLHMLECTVVASREDGMGLQFR